MKVEKAKKNNQVPFSELEVGDCFYLDGCLYMKIDTTKSELDNALFFSEEKGQWYKNCWRVFNNTIVSPVASKLVIGE